MPRARRSTLVAAVVLALALGACGGGDDGDDAAGDPSSTTSVAPPDPDALTVGTFEPVTLDPAGTVESAGAEIVRLLFDSLTDVDQDGNVVPAGASAWTASPDNTVFTFELVPGATFTSGERVTAADFAAGFARLADPDTAAPGAYKGSVIEGWDEVLDGEPSGAVGDDPIEGVRAVDRLTLEITTTSPLATLPALLADPVFSPVPPSALGARATSEAFADAPVGNGPYALEEPWAGGDSIQLARRDAVEPSLIDFRVFADPAAMYAQASAGNLDVSDVPTGRLRDARSRFDERFTTTDIGATTYLLLPTSAPFDDLDLRRALSLAIDREAITERVLEGTGAPASGMVPVAVGGTPQGCADCRYDPAEAEDLYEDGKGLRGDRLQLAFPSGEGFDELAEALANDWRANLGIETRFVSREFSRLLDAISQGDIDAPVLATWSGDYPSPLAFLGPLFESGSSDNLYGYENEQLDAALEAARAASPADADTANAAAQAIVDADLPAIPLSEDRRLMVVSERAAGVRVHPQGFRMIELAGTG